MRKGLDLPSGDQTSLETVFEQVLDCIENGREVDIESILIDKPELRPRIAELVQLAQEVSSVQIGPAPVTLSGYTVLRQLGRGGMGTVCLARQERAGGRLVALKILLHTALQSQNARNRFLHEATTLANLRHPHIVTVHDVIHEGRVYAYAMEWIEGRSLAQVIDFIASDRRPVEKDKNDIEPRKSDPSMAAVRSFLNAPEGALNHPTYAIFACRIAASIARALAEVHRAGLVHRDVKPSNILLRRDGTPLLSDFGLVRQAESSVLTQTGDFVGTPAFASPEQLRGDAPTINERSDIFSLGVTLYHALTFRLPHQGRTPTELLDRIEAGKCTPLRRINPALPRDLETIVAKSMDPDPTRRYATADDLADDLDRLLSLQPIKAKPATFTTRLMKAARRNRGHLLAVMIGVTMTLACMGAALAYLIYLPKWSERSLTQARLALLHPEQGNAMFDVEFYGDEANVSHSSIRREGLHAALLHYDAAIRWRPFNSEIRREREVVQEALGIRQQVSGSEHTPLIPNASERRSTGLFAFLTGDAAAAIDAWTQLDLQREPDAFVNAALGQLYVARGEYPRAYPRLRQAIDAFPNVSFLTQYLADAAVQCGDLEKAQQWLDLARQQPTQDLKLGCDRIQADLFAAQGRDEEAIALYQSIQLNNPVAQFNYARLLESRGRLEEAVRVYARVSQRIPKGRRPREAFIRTMHAWWTSLDSLEQHNVIRSALDRPFAHVDSFPALLSAFEKCTRISQESPALSSRNPAPYLQRDSESLIILAGKMEVSNLKRWNCLIKLPSVLKDWIAESWLSPTITIKGAIAELCADTWCAVHSAVQTRTIGAPGTSAGFPRRSPNRSLALSALMGLATTQGAALAGPNDPYWAERCVTGPSARGVHAMAYDSLRNVTVLFGGHDDVGPVGGDTWEWDGVAWSLRSTLGPSPLWAHTMSYDVARAETVLFGGATGGGQLSSDTWIWNGATWLFRTSAGPSARYQHAMAYDSERNVTVMFGGHSLALEGDTWEWNGTSWTLRSTSGPGPRLTPAMAYDSARGVVVLFGGGNTDGSVVYDDTWEWDGTSWTQRFVSGPSARRTHGMAYDSARGVTVLYAGHTTSYLDDTWAWDGTTWVQLPTGPGGRYLGPMVYDSARDRVVVFGGYNESGSLDDTWEFGSNQVDTSCDDGNLCTIDDTCTLGACSGTPINVAVVCNDNNPCTNDGCNPATGCTHANNTNACDDDNSCTTNDVCASGDCIGTPPPPWGDITPADCDPVVSGCNVVNLDDILCVLASFAGNYACAGGLANADIVPCTGNGVINLDDILGVLNAFTGANQCPCVP